MPRHRTPPHPTQPSPYRYASEKTRAAREAPFAEGAICDWSLLSEPLQHAVAREAMLRSAETIAGQAMVLAAEMEDGGLPDRGGAEALRLFAAVVRVTGREAAPPAGHA